LKRSLYVLALLICLAGLTMTALAQDQGRIRVGLVIQGQGGQTSTYCVSLSPDKATGLDVLRAANLDLNVQAGSLGAAVCRLQNLGCSYPAEPCFCQCQGATCNYWVYFTMDTPGKWTYSAQGAGLHKLKNGDVDGWLWNEGTGQTPMGSLPKTSFETICNAPTSAPGRASVALDNGLNAAGYILFAALAVVLGGVLLWRRNRSR
jgi:hypothetical protein